MAAARSRSASSPRPCRILSDGRLLLGLGVANKTIAAWHTGVFDRPLRRAREYIDIVRKVAAGERVEYEGEIYNTGKRFQLSWTPSHPQFPIYLAGLGPQMTKLVGKISDGVFINMGTPETIKEIAGRVREGAIEAGRDPNSIEIIAKVRVSLNPDRAVARSKLRQVLTFYNIADHYKDMLIASGFEPEVMRIQEAFKADGFKAAAQHMTDEYMDKLPVIPGTSIKEIKERLQPFIDAGRHASRRALRAGRRARHRRMRAASSKPGEIRKSQSIDPSKGSFLNVRFCCRCSCC